MTSTAPYTDTGAALLRAICLAPEDDGLRLIYADCLEENGQPERAELIRVQCDLDSLGFAEPREDLIRRNDRIGELARRQRSLWAKPETSAWFGGTSYIAVGRSIFESPSYKDKSSGLIRRGFIDEVRCTLADFMKHAQAIAMAHPVRKWVLTNFDAPQWGPEEYTIWDASTISLANQEGPEQGELPSQLFAMLENGVLCDGWRDYRTYDEAMADAAEACYHFARQQLTA